MGVNKYTLLLALIILTCPWGLAQQPEPTWDDEEGDSASQDEKPAEVVKWNGSMADVQKLLLDMESADIATQNKAAWELATIAPIAPPEIARLAAIPLANMLEKIDARYAYHALLKMKEHAAPAVPLLVEWLAFGDWNNRHAAQPRRYDAELRSHAAEILKSIGEPVEPYLPQILRMYGNGEPLSVSTALVGKLGPRAMPALIETLKEGIGISGTCQYTLWVLDNNLGKLGDSIQQAVPYIVSTVRDNRLTIGVPRDLAKVCLLALTDLLGCENALVRQDVIDIFYDLRDGEASTLPLIEALVHNNPRVRATVLELLAHPEIDFGVVLSFIDRNPKAVRINELKKSLQNQEIPLALRSTITEIIWSIENREKMRQQDKKAK